MAKIGLDPGHGGMDVGAIGVLSQEAANMLKVVLFMKSKLEKYGHTVVLTCASNVFVSLVKRGQIVNSYKVGAFISLHQNSASNNTATGFETFIYQHTTNNKTINLQNSIHNAISNVVPCVNRGKKRANFQVLRDAVMPAVLIEYGFIYDTKGSSGFDAVICGTINDSLM